MEFGCSPVYTRLREPGRRKLVALHFLHYDFGRIHKRLRITPAMAAGISDHVWSIEEIVEMIDRATPKPGVRGPYNKRSAK